MSDLTGEAERSRAAKAALRGRLLAARRALSPSALAAAAAHLQDQTLAFVRRENPSTVATYVPVGSEPGGADLPSVLAAAGVRVLLPVLLPDNDLDWAVFTGSLVAGRRGLLEPDGPRLGVDGIRAAEVILVPALAVDPEGRRMGRGGGSYDRVLARLDPPGRPGASWPPPDVLRSPADAPPSPADVPRSPAARADAAPAASRPVAVALLHDGELVESVPAEPHDRPVHGVITPTGGFAWI